MSNLEEFLDFMDFDDHLAKLQQKAAHKPRTVQKNRPNHFEDLTEAEFSEQFGLSKSCFGLLLEKIENNIFQPKNQTGNPVQPSLQILITLRYLVTGNDQSSFGDLFGVSQGYASKCIQNVAVAISDLLPNYIRFPPNINSIKRKFESIAGIPDIIGCIDCIHLAVQKPSVEEAAMFQNSEGFYSFNLQAVCGPDLQFYNLVARWPGGTNDKDIFKKSQLCKQLREGKLSGSLLGDNDYPCKPYLLTPLSQPQSMPEMNYNHAHNLTRSCVEHAFSMLKQRFGFMSKTARTKLKNSQILAIACFVLHNMAIIGRGEGIDQSVVQEEDDDEMEGDAVRRDIIERRFNQRYLL